MAEPNQPNRGSESDVLNAEQLRRAVSAAADGVLRGESATDVVGRLGHMGLDLAAAVRLEENVRAAVRLSRLRIAMLLMISGFFWLVAAGMFYVIRAATGQGAGPGIVRFALLIAALAVIQIVIARVRWRRAKRL